MFTSEDVSWHVLQDATYLLGGMRAVILQLAEPGVAQGVAEHSDFVKDPFGRAERTLQLMQTVGLGDPHQANDAIREMRRAHAVVHGTMPDGAAYHAHDPDLQLWVLATLIDTVMVVEERYLGRFDDATRRRYYQEARQVADVFGMENMPETLAAFRAYMDERTEQIEVTDVARSLSRHVLRPRIRFVPKILLGPLRLMAIDMLPPPVRAAFDLSITDRQARWVGRAQAASRAVIPRLPSKVRRYSLRRTPVSTAASGDDLTR